MADEESTVRYEHSIEGNAEENDLDLDEGNEMLCNACALPVFSTPFTKVDGHFSLHKDCANLPNKLDGHVLHPKPLKLIKKLPEAVDDIICRNCHGKCKGFFYQCPENACGYALDVLCAMPIGRIKIVHRSHRHELVPVHGNTSVTCGACEMESNGKPSYLCNLCGFGLHRDCALLPNTIRHHKHEQPQHLLCLFFFTGLSLDETCFICDKEVSGSLGCYNCTGCSCTAHIKCATSDTDSFRPVLRREAVGSLPHLPMDDEGRSVVCFLLDNASSSGSSATATQVSIEEHDHPLIFHKEGPSSSSSYLCNGCVEPVEPPFYSCPQCSDFYLHFCCANLPPQIRYRGHGCSRGVRDSDDYEPRLTLLPRSRSDDISSRFRCGACNRHCNGFQYHCEKCSVSLDVRCSHLPRAITHKAHSNTHILTLTFTSRPSHEKCQCCGDDIKSFYYNCNGCRNFILDTGCALLLPMRVTHKYDKHPLKLITTTPSSSKYGEHFCEICEMGLDEGQWFYGCHECDQSFHVKCIPCVGEYSNIKFGGKVRVRCHGCPLTSVRLLTSYSHTCRHCQKTMQGKKDGMAFKCCKCYFWMHDDCAREEWIRD